MKLLVWNENQEKYKDQIRHLMLQLGFVQVIQVDNLQEFHKQLLQFRSEIEIILIAPASKSSLEQLMDIQELLDGIRLVVALPDTATESLNLALKLFPRYVSQDGDPPGNIELVLLNMLQRKS